MATKTKKGAAKAVKTSTKQTPTKKLTAAQRIDMLERLVLQFGERSNVLAEEIDRLRSLTQTLNKKLTASISATESEDAVKDILVSENIKELEGRVTFLVERGVLVKNDEMTVVDKTFVVGRDVDANGKVVNPRVQFSVETLPQDLKDTVLGKKLGDMIKPEGAETSLEILEVYEIHDMNVDKQFKAQTPEEAPEEVTEGVEAEA